MGPQQHALATLPLTASLAELGQRLLELQRALVAVDPQAAGDPRLVAAVQASEQRVEHLHLRAWSAAAGPGAG